MSIVKVESRVCSLCLGMVVVVMLLLLVSFLWVTAGVAAPTTKSTPTLLDKRDTGTVQLPGGMDAMDIVRMVERNRAGIDGRGSVSESGLGVPGILDESARYERECFGSASVNTGLPLPFAGETQPLGWHASAAIGAGPTFPIGGDAICEPAHFDQSNPAIAFDGTNYLVVWRDYRRAAHYYTSYDIFGARVSPDGVVLDIAGISISTASYDQGNPAVAFDGTNYLVVWNDNRSYSSNDIYGARVSTGGSVLDPGGIAISTAVGDQYVPAISFDGTNYLVVWEDMRGGSYFDIYGARVSTAGSVLDPGGIAISSAANSQYYPAVAFDGTNYLVVWSDARDGAWNADIYGSRVTVDGTVLDPSGTAISTAANFQYDPAIAFDGTNYLVAWDDYRSGTTRDIYGSRVTVGGSALDPSGIAISTAASLQYYPEIAFDGTNYLVAWYDFRSGTSDIYGARVSVGGAVLDPGGLAISTAANGQRWLGIAFDGTNCLVVWEDYRGGSYYDIYGSRVSTGGSVLDPAGMAVSTATNDQRWPATAFDGTDYLVVWQDDRGGSYFDIYGARVSTGGIVLDPTGIAISTAANDQVQPAVAFDGTNYLVIWTDQRSGDWDIYGARVSTGGSVLDPAGIAVSAAPQGQFYTAIAFDGTNYLAVWYDFRSGSNHDIYGARVSPGGSVLDPAGIAISTAANSQRWPAVAFDGTNYLVVWDDPRGGSYDVYGARVSTGGTVLDPSGIAISSAADNQECPSIAFDGTNFFVVWHDSRGGTGLPDVYGARVTTGGSVLDATGIAVSTAFMGQWYPDVVFDGTGYLVVWQDSRVGSHYDIYGTRVSVGGSVLDPDGMAMSTASAGGNLYSPCISKGSGGQVLIGYGSWITADKRGQIWGTIWGPYVGVEQEEAPSAYRISQSYPNPFNPMCTIPFEIARAGMVSLKVFDVNGSRVRTLVDGWRESGEYNEVWDGRRDDGTTLPSGVYFCRLEADKFVATRKMVLLR